MANYPRVKEPDMATVLTKPPTTKLLTATDLLRLAAEGVRGELIRGVLHETMIMGVEHGEIAVNLVAEMRHFVKPRKLGRLTCSDTGVWLERDPDTVRGPDIAYFSAAKMPLEARIPGYAEVVPEMVVEVVSPNDTRREVAAKARMWLRYDVRLVWVVLPQTRSVDVYRPGRAVVTLADEDTLDGLDVLPGFTCAVSAVFDT